MIHPDELERHIFTLARELRVELHVGLQPMHWRHAGADVYGKRVMVAPITGPVTYATALHELGHIAHAHRGMCGMPCELEAWAWARQHSLMWTPAMVEAQEGALRSYEGSVEIPPEVMDELAKRGDIRPGEVVVVVLGRPPR